MVMGECLKSFDWAHDIFLFFFFSFLCAFPSWVNLRCEFC